MRAAAREDEDVLDLSSLMDGSDDDPPESTTLTDLPPLLDASVLDELEPQDLTPSALRPLDPELDVLSASALERIDDEPARLPSSAFAPADAIEPEEVEPPIPLIEGFEDTRLDRSISPRLQRRAAPPADQGATAASEFSYAACPACQAPQPHPVPSFCEACGARLKTKSSARKALLESQELSLRCGECGTQNATAALHCRNCGLPLRSPR